LGRNVEAYKELTAVIAECDARGARYAATATAAYAKRDEIEPRIGLLTVEQGNAPKGTHVVVGEDKLAPGDMGKQFAVLPGESRVVAITPDGKKHTQKVTVRTGTKETIALDIPKEKEKVATPSEPPFDELDHPKYAVEFAAYVVGETVPPNNTESRGAGPGAHLYVNVLPRGLITGLNDSFAVGVGGDAFLTSSKVHMRIPVTVQWNFWLTNRFAVLLEPGASLVVGAGTHLQPAIYAGARYALGSSIAIMARAGIPDVAIGVSMLF
jgi:hypothetical protein